MPSDPRGWAVDFIISVDVESARPAGPVVGTRISGSVALDLFLRVNIRVHRRRVAFPKGKNKANNLKQGCEPHVVK